MGTNSFKTCALSAAVFALLTVQCKKKNSCIKDGLEYTNSTSVCAYSPVQDSIPLGDSIFLEASLPKQFLDESWTAVPRNTSANVEGPLHIVMLYPQEQGGADFFKLDADIGNILKDSSHFSQGQLKGFRTIRWDGTHSDSFRIKIVIKPQTPGVFCFALGRQSSKDANCALYKYFLRVGNEQHLNYLLEYNNGYVSDYERNFSYSFKVY